MLHYTIYSCTLLLCERYTVCTSQDGKNVSFSKKTFPKLDALVFYENVNKQSRFIKRIMRKQHYFCQGGDSLKVKINPLSSISVTCFQSLSSRRAVLSLKCKTSEKTKCLILFKNPSLNVIKYYSVIHQIIHTEGCCGPA